MLDSIEEVCCRPVTFLRFRRNCQLEEVSGHNMLNRDDTGGHQTRVEVGVYTNCDCYRIVLFLKSIAD